MEKGDVRVDFGSYAKDFKGVDMPVIDNTNGTPILRIKKGEEINVYNWNKVTGVTFKSKEGNKK